MMSTAWKSVRVFISSTFCDMHAERDHLVTVVFPELRERIEGLGLEFFDVDLRWGVPDKDANGETANSWEYCRKWIDRVEPFFICILGQRYGHVPKPDELKDKEDSQRQQLERRSITEMELRHAVLDRKLNRRSYFYLRATDAPASASEYVDPAPLLSKLQQLKGEVRSCGRPVRDYLCEWTGSGFTSLEEFGRLVLDDLWSGVLRDDRYVGKEVWRRVLGAEPGSDARYTDEFRPIPHELAAKLAAHAKPTPREPLDAEREQMEAFAQTRLRWFHGRTKELKQLTDFVNSKYENSPCLAAVVAVSGQGKSAMLARLWQEIAPNEVRSARPSGTLSPSDRERERERGHFVITHFVGATERSASAHSLVERLLDELDRSGVVWPPEQHEEGHEPKRDFKSLCLRLAQRLGNYAGERRIVVLLDGLNQLSDGHDLVWLPTQLGPSVRVIVSCLDESPLHAVPDHSTNDRIGPLREADSSTPVKGPSLLASPATVQQHDQRVLRALGSREPAPLLVPLAQLTEAEVRTIVVAYLQEYCHELDTEHLDTLCAITQARNPLYLLVTLDELRTLSGNDLNHVVPARIASMPRDHPDTVSVFRRVLQRLEAFGAEAVRWWCLYLAYGRAGMASRELVNLLASKIGADGAATALRIERGLRRYLQRRGPQLDFFHGQLRQAVFEQYSPQVAAVNVHSDIATYFREQGYWLDAAEEQSRRHPGAADLARAANVRAVTELPWQLLGAGRSEEMAKVLCDLEFVDSKCTAGMVFDLSADFTRASQVADLPAHQVSPLREFARFISSQSHFLAHCWGSAFQQALNEPDKTEPAKAARGRCISGVENRAYLEWINKSQSPSPCLLTLPRHTGGAFACAFSPRGERILTAGSEYVTRLWDTASGEEIANLTAQYKGHRGTWVFSPDGTLVVGVISDSDSADRDEVMLTFRVWNALAGQLVHSFDYWHAAVSGLAVSPNGTQIVSLHIDGSVALWGLSTAPKPMKLAYGSLGAWKRICRLMGFGRISACGFSGDGRLVIGKDSWGQTTIWLAATGERVPTKSVATIALPCKDLLAGQHFYDALDSSRASRLAGFRFPELKAVEHIMAFAKSPDRTLILAGHSDMSLRIWDVASGKQIALLAGHSGHINDCAFSPDGHRFASVSSDETVKIWDVQAFAASSVSRTGHTNKVSGVTFTRDGRRFATSSWDCTVRLFDGDNALPLVTLAPEWSIVQCCAFAPDGTAGVSGTDRGTLRIWDGESGRTLKLFDAIAEEVTPRHPSIVACSFSSDSSQVLAVTEGGGLILLDETGNATKFRSADVGVFSCAFSPDALHLALGVVDGTIALWSRVGTSREFARVARFCASNDSGDENIAWTCAFSMDCSWIASGHQDGTIRIWNVVGRKAHTTFAARGGTVQACCFSPNGRYLAVGCADHAVRIWDWNNGALRCEYGAGGLVSAITWRPNGRALVAGDKQGRVLLIRVMNL